MPVRIYDIARKVGIESKEVLAKAKELGIAGAKVPSSSLDKITAEYLEQQILAARPQPATPAPVEPPTPPQAAVDVPPAAPEPVETPVAPAPTVTPITPPPVVEPSAKVEAKPEPVAPLTPASEAKISTPVAPISAPAPAEPVASPAVPVPTPAPQPPLAEKVEEVKPAATAPVEKISPAPVEPSKPEPALEPAPAPAPPPAPAPLPATLVQPAPAAPKPAPETTPAPAPAAPATPPPPAAPHHPPAPRVPGIGDKVGFIQLPTKGAKAPERPAPPKPAPKPGRPEQPPRQQGQRFGNGQQPGGRPPFGRQQQPSQGRQQNFPPRPGQARPSAAPDRFTPPTSGEMITMKPPIIVRNLADTLKRKPFQLIADLMELNVFATVNQSIEETVAQRLCAKYGFRFEVEKRERGAGLVHAPVIKKEVDVEEKPEDLRPRPPVVTIMGHVDHGKTSLLDVIRKSNVVAGEAGGITQHIGAYTISFPHPERPQEIQQITFLDTPGHAAFSAMRARGANVTDIVVLVVAANDGVMPQTMEAISHAQAAKVPIMVAVNKCDHPNANPMRVRQQLQEHGLVCEEWGGSTIFQDLSALTKQGVDKLLELILLQAEMMELKANPTRRAKGNVIESGLEPGGPTATVLVRKGTLRLGEVLLCGTFWGKARALISEEGKRLKEAGPSVAVKLLGLNGVPDAGMEFSVVENEKLARELCGQREEENKTRSAEDRPKVTLESLFKNLSTDSAKVLKVVVKADTQGSVEAIVEALKKIESSKVSLEIIQSAVGIITESDVLLASASKAIVLGFHTRVDGGAADAAKHENVQIKLYSIIYELIDEVTLAMAGLLEPISKEVSLGMAEVRKVFSMSKGGNVAGCMITNGRVVKGRCRILRRKEVLFEGAIGAIRRFQDEVTEVRAGLECGIRVDGFADFQNGDIIESYHIEKITQKL